MPSRWIVGVDGSDGALAALRWAARHAPRAGAELTAVSAFQLPLPLVMLAAKRGFDTDRLGIEAEARFLLDEAVAAVETDVPVERLALEGTPAQTLLDAAADADLLIVGRRGQSVLRHMILGSVSRYCATHADVPVVVVPESWAAEPFGSVAVGFDGSANAAAALEWALAIAPADVPVRIVVAIEPAPWLGEDITMARFPGEVRAEEERILAVADAVDPDHRAERVVRLHGPRQALADAAGTADLVVVGARGHGRIGAALLGSVTSWMLHNSPRPIVVVPREPGADR